MNQSSSRRSGSGNGFIAALDQSGGSTPEGAAALRRRGGRLLATTRRCSTGCTRCAAGSSPARASPATGCSAPSSSRRPWTARSRARARPTTCGRSSGVVPFLKVDKGLADEVDGAQVMKPMPDLDELLDPGGGARACSAPRCARSSSWPTRPASTPWSTSSSRWAARSSAAGLVPIIEPEVDIHSPQKAEAEALLKAAILAPARQLAGRPAGDAQAHAARRQDGFYSDARGPPEGAPGRGPLRRLQPRRGQRPPGPQPRRDRQLLPGPHRGPHRPSSPTRSSTPRSTASIKGIYEASIT